MGFLLGYEYATLTMMSSSCSKDSDSNYPSLYKSKLKCGKKNIPKSVKQPKEQGRHVKFAKAWLKPWAKVKEVARVQYKQQPKIYVNCPIDITIQQCLEKTLKNLNAKACSSEKLSIVKINRATSEIVLGVKCTVDFDSKDELSGRPYSSELVIVLQPSISEEPTIMDYKCTPRASI